ncbi:hypothetical protein Tco_1216045 [Tanacetum coccineum]
MFPIPLRHVLGDSELASLFRKLKYEENLIDSIYDTEKKKSLTTITPLSTTFFSTSIVQDFQDSHDDEEDTRSSQEYMNDLEMEFHKRALLAKSKRFFKKVLTALADDENGVVGKKSARNGEWVKISMRKVHTLLEMDDNDEIKSFLDYLCVDLNFVEEQRTYLMIKHRDIVQELNTCKENLLELKQAKLDFLTIQLGNTEILNENQTLKKELKELTEITKTWLNSSNKMPPVMEKRLTKGFNLPNYDTGRVLSIESNVNVIEFSIKVNVTDSSVIDYDSVEESTSVCSILIPPIEKLLGVEPQIELQPGPKTTKSILKACSSRKAETSKDVVINEIINSSAPAKGTKNVIASKRNSAFSGKLKNVKTKDGIPMSVFDEEIRSIFNSNKEVMMIAPRIRDVYVLDMTSSAQESCFFAKDSHI